MAANAKEEAERFGDAWRCSGGAGSSSKPGRQHERPQAFSRQSSTQGAPRLTHSIYFTSRSRLFGLERRGGCRRRDRRRVFSRGYHPFDRWKKTFKGCRGCHLDRCQTAPSSRAYGVAGSPLSPRRGSSSSLSSSRGSTRISYILTKSTTATRCYTASTITILRAAASLRRSGCTCTSSRAAYASTSSPSSL